MTAFKFGKILLTTSLVALFAGCANNSNLNYPATVDPGEPGIVDVDYTPIDEQNETDILLACADFANRVIVRGNKNGVDVKIEGDRRITKAKFEEVAADVASYVKASRNSLAPVSVSYESELTRYKSEF